MILVYVDESGDTGLNLSDPQQPVFVLGAILIAQEQWKSIEKQFRKIMTASLPGYEEEEFELHTMDLVARKGPFKNLELKETIGLRDNLINLIKKNKIPVFYRKIEKKRYAEFCEQSYGSGIKINPYIMAFPFISLKVDDWLSENKELGIFIFDDSKSHLDIEKSLKTLRLTEDLHMKLDNIIEKGFFIESKKSYAVQLVDLVLYYIRKMEEAKLGKNVSSIHRQTFPLIESIATNIDRYVKGGKILEWVSAETKK